eukprot:2755186-Rhodomonas_salina.2
MERGQTPREDWLAGLEETAGSDVVLHAGVGWGTGGGSRTRRRQVSCGRRRRKASGGGAWWLEP